MSINLLWINFITCMETSMTSTVQMALGYKNILNSWFIANHQPLTENKLDVANLRNPYLDDLKLFQTRTDIRCSYALKRNIIHYLC